MATTIIGRVAMLWKGEWDSSIQYDALDVVLAYDGSYYVSNKKNKGVNPIISSAWSKMIDMYEVKRVIQETKEQGSYAKEQGDAVKPFATDMADINRDMGKYQQLPDVTLTIVESGKRIDKEGNFVADSSFNIGRLGAVSKGNIYELLMGGSDKMVLGTALFVSHTIERIGGQDKDVYKPIYSAVNVDLPISTYAVLLAGEDYSDVLVSYRNDVAGANTMKVARWGIFASIATQLANLRGDVDLKSFSDGYYDNMGVGFAKNLIGDGEATAEEFTERVAGGTHQIDDALAEYVTIKGNSICLRQSCVAPLSEKVNVKDGVTFTQKIDGKVTVQGIASKNTSFDTNIGKRTIGHKYLLHHGIGSDMIDKYDACDAYDTNSVAKRKEPFAHIYTKSTSDFMVRCYVPQGDVEATFYPRLIDLTDSFPNNVDSINTVDDVAKLIGFNTWANFLSSSSFEYWMNNHIVNMTAEGVKTTGRNLWDEEWEVGNYSWYTGVKIDDSSRIRTKNYIPIISKEISIIKGSHNIDIYFYDKSKSFISSLFVRHDVWHVVIPENAEYFTFSPYASYGSTYNNDIAIFNYVQGMSTDYEPHVTSERKWAETMKKCFPDGMAKAGNVYDEFGATNAVKRLRMVNLGDIEWEKITANPQPVFYSSNSFVSGAKGASDWSYSLPCAICQKYGIFGWEQIVETQVTGITINSQGTIVIQDQYYNDESILKRDLDGIYLVYELAEPVVTTYDELNLTSRVWRNGMEEIIVPEGKESSPISADVIYQINAFKTIKANKQGIEDLNAKPAISLTAEEVAKLRALINTNTQNLEE